MDEDAGISAPVIWILGGPGSGKGTQCDKIVAKYGLIHLSSGDLLRAEVESGSERGKNLNAVMERGELVSAELVLELIKDEMLKNKDTAKGFLIDGYPREKEQGILFEKNIAPATIILFFDVKEETLIARLTHRSETSGRVDDNAEAIKKRLQTFNANNNKIVEHYVDKVKTINAEGTVDDIFKEVESYLDPIIK